MSNVKKIGHTQINSKDQESKAIEKLILNIHDQQVMIDYDIATLYGVETKVLNQAVKRNIDRFPDRFMFQLSKEEKDELVTNCDRFKKLKHSSSCPYAFTEQGIAMLSAILKSETAVSISIQIMDAFVAMRHILTNNAHILLELENIKKHLLETNVHQLDADRRIDELFEKFDLYKIKDKKGIFFQGQIFDAYAKFESFLQSATSSIILIDGYVDVTVLERLSKKNSNVKVEIYTSSNSRITQTDIDAFNAQYPTLTIKYTTAMHDRFLIIDNNSLLHIGASLKDLGKKMFCF
ncbi:MAG: ORF6N domain-containing protein [Paludibacteraceae bacterium]|nr:ORF6N domain-containing protein [Paludibacteraceae bacterium]